MNTTEYQGIYSLCGGRDVTDCLIIAGVIIKFQQVAAC